MFNCIYCGKFISYKDLEDESKTKNELVYSGGPIPEPDYVLYWHIKCEEKQAKIKPVTEE